jgi:LmbE family N-acetylglucosaminyl deacetylase
MRRVLWIFAHQDDEVAAAPRILEQRRRGDVVRCLFLCGDARRDAESIAALKALGVTEVESLRFPDGQVVDHLDAAFAQIRGDADEVGCLAYEGGHQDHDAAYLLAVAYARSLGVPAYEVPLYNGAGLPFRVFKPIGQGWERRRVAMRDALETIGLVRFYKSQRRTWLGLLPEGMLRLLILRSTYVRKIERIEEVDRPFYERRFKFPRERFVRAAAAFRARHLSEG